MKLKSLSKAALQRQAEIFLDNGVADDIQAVISKGGCTLAFLAEGRQLLDTWLTAQFEAAQLKGKQKKATQAQWDAHDLANQEMVWLADMVRGELGHDEPLLTSLGLWTPTQSGGTPEATTSETPPPAASTADTPEAPPSDSDAAAEAETPKKRSGPKGLSSLAADVARWQQLCRGVLALEEDPLGKLAEVGWDVAHIQEALASVNAVATADTAQQVAIQAYQAGTAHAGNLKKEMEAWYRRAVRRAKQAVDRHDPDNRDRWLKRLGL